MSEQIWEKYDNVPIGIRRRNAVEDPHIKHYLDDLLEKISRHNAVEHPFLNAYRTTALTPEQEKHLYCECFHFFRYLPFYITGMAIRTRDEMILREIITNVADEIGTDPTHSVIYQNFLDRIGISKEEVESYQPLDVTVKLNDGIRKLYTETDIQKALGALYADETMSSIMVSKLNDGLLNQGYGTDIRHFWLLHIDVEVGHSNSVFNAIAPYVDQPESMKLFEDGTWEFLRLLEAYWDGVQELVGIETPQKLTVN